MRFHMTLIFQQGSIIPQKKPHVHFLSVTKANIARHFTVWLNPLHYLKHAAGDMLSVMLVGDFVAKGTHSTTDHLSGESTIIQYVHRLVLTRNCRRPTVKCVKKT